jgi:hypothetical protein
MAKIRDVINAQLNFLMVSEWGRNEFFRRLAHGKERDKAKGFREK